MNAIKINKELNQIVFKNDEINMALDQKSYKNWYTIFMIAIRNIFLSRVYFNNKNQILDLILQ